MMLNEALNDNNCKNKNNKWIIDYYKRVIVAGFSKEKINFILHNLCTG